MVSTGFSSKVSGIPFHPPASFAIKEIQWGGYFQGGGWPQDYMHFQRGGTPPAGGSWAEGFHPDVMAKLGLKESGGLGAVAQQMQQQGYSQEEILNALASIESRGSGDYAAVGAEADPAGHRARGRYQVMDYNVGPWAEQYLGMKGVTPEQFQKDPALQDKLTGAVMSDYIKKYGERGAFSKWFTGSENEPNVSDVHGKLTGKTYADMAMEQLMRGNNKAPTVGSATGDSPGEVGGARFGGTGLGSPAEPQVAAADAKDSWWKKFGKNLGKSLTEGGGMAAAGGPVPTGITDTPRAALASTAGVTYGDAGSQEADIRRQNLAQIMARLNSQKLWG
jgi:hypothetical protein